MDTKKIGAFIAMNRKKKGYTQEQLAEKLGVTNKTISRWEKWSFPNERILEKIHETPAFVKGITIEYYIF